MICKAVLRNVFNFPICAHIILFSKEYEKDKKTHNILGIWSTAAFISYFILMHALSPSEFCQSAFLVMELSHCVTSSSTPLQISIAFKYQMN